MKVALYLFTQRRAAANEVTNASTQTFVDGIENDLAKIQRRLVAQPGVSANEIIGSLTNPITPFVEPIFDATMQ